MGNPIYEYVDEYLKRSSFSLLMLDLWIIWKGIQVIVKGGGHWAQGWKGFSPKTYWAIVKYALPHIKRLLDKFANKS